MISNKYLMENDEESVRLEKKTNIKAVEKQAVWAGIRPGMSIADLGCGPGITSNILHRLVSPTGSTLGVDFSNDRITYAKAKYKKENLSFLCRDIREPLEDLGMFDFVFVRFVLEYYLKESFEIVNNIKNIIKPDGILCLVDLDYNCLTHFGIPDRLNTTVTALMSELQEKANFDPFVGRKLYSYLYDLDFINIAVNVEAHHNIYGELSEPDKFNWVKKVEVAPNKIDFKFKEYGGNKELFLKEFRESFAKPRRFTYTPLIICRGNKKS
jgi:SAM-dependent methyltransferase